MTRYTYAFSNDALPGVANLVIKEGEEVCARAKFITVGPRPNFETYSVTANKRGRGLSYAITYLLMLRAKDLGYASVEVADAHGYLIPSLQHHNFAVTHNRPMMHPPAASLECNNLAAGLASCKRIMVRLGLIADGFRAV
jgi:hypothetical protein